MSHWKTFTNDTLANTKTDMLATALAKMGVELDTTIKSVKNTWGNAAVDMGLKKDGKTIAIGFKEVNGKLELRGDFYGTGLRESSFMDELSQHYQVEDIVSKIEGSMWNIEGEPTVNEQGEVEILAYIYA